MASRSLAPPARAEVRIKALAGGHRSRPGESLPKLSASALPSTPKLGPRCERVRVGAETPEGGPLLKLGVKTRAGSR